MTKTIEIVFKRWWMTFSEKVRAWNCISIGFFCCSQFCFLEMYKQISDLFQLFWYIKSFCVLPLMAYIVFYNHHSFFIVPNLVLSNKTRSKFKKATAKYYFLLVWITDSNSTNCSKLLKNTNPEIKFFEQLVLDVQFTIRGLLLLV